MKFKTSPCQGCGKPIVWAADPKGHAIPLDPKPALYVVTEGMPDATVCQRLDPNSMLVAGDVATVMVTHFATCPKASEFSGRNKAR
jgi:hypothetical protein